MGRFICWCLCMRQTAALSVSLSLFASFRRSTPQRREEVESTVELPDVKCSLLIQHCVGQHHRGTMNCVKKKKSITMTHLKSLFLI